MGSNIIETNILIVANQPNHEAGEDCHAACRRFLFDIIQQQRRIAIDFEGHIFREYFTHANLKGQPGLGDMFFRWLHERQGFEHIVEQVPIDAIDLPEALNGFDKSDLKFVQTATGCRHKPAIIHNATDSDWLFFEQTTARKMYLEQAEVSINQLCPECLKAI
jgi:hypothetical protein